MTSNRRHQPFDEPLTVERITKDIILLSMPTQKEIGQLLVRFQEYYESNIPDIRGKVFTLGYLKMRYAQEVGGAYTYVSSNLFRGDWTGFNFPSYVLKPFIDGKFDPLTPAEQDLVDMFRHRRDDTFYIVGVGEDEDLSVDHEINHGIYYTIPEYQKEVDDVLKDWDQVPALKEMFRSWAYCEDVLIDEIHAYISADYDWLEDEKCEDLEKFCITLDPAIRQQLWDIRAKYFEPIDPKYRVMLEQKDIDV